MNRIAAGAGVIGAAGFAIFHSQWPTSQLYGATICRSRSGERKIAFTYDDGPNPAHTPKLMQVLDRFKAKATFFLIGRWAEREPELIRELHAAGHAIGNHTHTHPRMPLLSTAGVTEELARCRAAVEGSGVEFTQVDGQAIMRPPYGNRRPGTLRAIRSAGYVPVTWSVTCYDWRRTATEGKIARRARRAIEGDVILLHDGSHTGPAVDRSNSVAATEDALRKLSDQGYEFVTVPELMAA